MTDNQTNHSAPAGKDAGSKIGSVASDIKSAASHKFDEAVTEVRHRADDARSDVADEVNDVAKALRRASDELRGGSAQERTLGQISSSLADASDAIRDKDLGEMVQMASKLARENPVLFIGGAALLGFAVSRYAKASGTHDAQAKPGPSQTERAQVDTFVSEGNPNTQPRGVPA
jgi:ElaB/YqjD/DUF883 family membrane-anchored ribosome-binding protein